MNELSSCVNKVLQRQNQSNSGSVVLVQLITSIYSFRGRKNVVQLSLFLETLPVALKFRGCANLT